MLNVQGVFEAWCPPIETTVDEVKTSVDPMRFDLNKIVHLLEPDPFNNSTTAPGVLGPFESAAGRPPGTATHADGQPRHHVDPIPREHGYRLVYTHNHLPANGTNFTPSFQASDHVPRRSASKTQDRFPYQSPHLLFGGRAHGSQFSPYLGQLPKMNFPAFDGENPKLWMARCEDYFLMYSVDPLA